MAQSIRERLRSAVSKVTKKLTDAFTTTQPDIILDVGRPNPATFQHHHHIGIDPAETTILHPTGTGPPLGSNEGDDADVHMARRFSEPIARPNLRNHATNQEHHILALRESLMKSQEQSRMLRIQLEKHGLQNQRCADMQSTITALRVQVNQLKGELMQSKSKTGIRAELELEKDHVETLKVRVGELEIHIVETEDQIVEMDRRAEEMQKQNDEMQRTVRDLREGNAILAAAELYLTGILAGMDGQPREELFEAIMRGMRGAMAAMAARDPDQQMPSAAEGADILDGADLYELD